MIQIVQKSAHEVLNSEQYLKKKKIKSQLILDH